MQCVYDLWSLSGGVAVWWMCQYEYFMMACVYVEHIWCQSGGLWLPLWVCFTPRWPKLQNFPLLSRFYAILSKFLKEIRFSTPLKLPSIQFGPKKTPKSLQKPKKRLCGLGISNHSLPAHYKTAEKSIKWKWMRFWNFRPAPQPKTNQQTHRDRKKLKANARGMCVSFLPVFYVRS